MFVLNQNTQIPLYVQLFQQLRGDMLSGKLAPHSKLPSVRELAVELATSRNTVETAYEELLAEGYIYSRPRSGFFVSPLDQDLAPHKPLANAEFTWGNEPSAAIDSPPHSTRRLEASHNLSYDFHPARLSPQSFPAALWRRLFGESLQECDLPLGHYCDPQGDRELRICIQRYLERCRGVLCDAEQIIICSGLQHALDMVAHLLKGSHHRLAVENPGYFIPRHVFGNHAFEVVPIPLGPGGLDLEALRSSDCSMVYVTPSHQFPMGHVMPIANRLQLIEWAESRGAIILEDDYDSELRYHGEPIPSLQGLRPHGNIVYLGTVSKVLSPGLRLSYMILPRHLLDRYHAVFGNFFGTVSLLEQRTLAKFMEEGYWYRHLRRMRTDYQKKHDALLRAIERHFASKAVVIGQGAGLHVVLQLVDNKLSERELVARAAAEGIYLTPFSVTQVGGEAGSGNVMLGFGAMAPEQLARGVELLVKAWY